MRPTTKFTLATALATAFGLAFFTGPDPAAAPAGLVAAYNFNEGAGSVLTDVSGNGNNGTLANGVAWTTAGRTNGALNFDGTNDIVNIPHSASLNLTTGVTLEAWVRPTVGTNWRTILMKERPGNIAYGLYGNTQYAVPAFELATTGSAGNLEAASSTRLTLNAWSHVAATYDGSTLRLYVNGTQVSSRAASGTILTSTNALRIGGNTVWGEYFRGQIDDVRIYRQALTAAEIQTDMNTPVVAAPVPDTAPPTVSLTAPTNGSTVSGTSVTISATASDNVGVAGVQFTLDGVNVGSEDTSAPYSISWNSTGATDGPHTLAAVARDAAGNRTTATSVSVTVNNFVDTVGPTVGMTAPANGSTISGTVTISASASDNVGVAGVQFIVDGVNAGGEDTSAPYAISWNTTTAADGPHTVSAVARDAAGNRTTATAVSVTVNNFVDTTGPTVGITAPANGSTVSGTTVTISANATDNVGVVGVQFTLDGVNVGAEDTSAPYAITWNTTATADGPHTVAAVARDAAGNRTTATAVSVTVDNFVDTTGPTVGITAPANGSTVSGTTVAISANAADNVGVVGVQFTVDGVNVGAEDTSAPYSITWNTTTAADGPHTVAAVARDAAGNRTTATSVSVTVDNFVDTTGPTVGLTAPANGSTVSGTVAISANASDNVGVVGVQFTVDGVNVGGEDTSAPYSISWDTTTAADGPHTLAAVARDAAGNRTTATSVSVTVDNFVDTTGPTVAIASPANNSTVSATVSVSATASDNVGVVGVQFLMDGANWGAEDTSAPYSISWNTTTASNGPHTLAAIARDAAGNRTTSTSISVTVDNFVDTTGPTVGITAPANGANVSATVSVSASASDNVGVVGVQFTLDGANLGAEDTTAPYSVSWNTTTASNGPHTLAAVARDAAGNRTTAGSISVTVGNFSDTTGPTVSITAPANNAELQSTVVISANATDNVGVVGVQFKVDNVNVGNEDTSAPYSVNWNSANFNNGPHTITAVARDAANNTTTSAPVQVTVGNSITLGTLNFHTVAGDSSNKLISWLGSSDTAYETAVEIAFDFLLNRVPNDWDGRKSYLTHSYLMAGSLDPSGWENNPADKNAGIIESALPYYAYSGDTRVITLAREWVDYHLDNGMTAPNGVWPSVPYASGCGDCPVFDGSGSDGQGYIEPDKVGSFGYALLQLYQFTGSTRYRDAAIAAGNALAANVRTGNATSSPWPFRVHAQNGSIKEDYTAHTVAPISLLSELIRLNLGNVAAYQSAKTTALNWLMTYPMQNNVWANYFEDVGVQNGLYNINNVSPLETALYLMQHPEDDPNWQTHVPALIAWVENNLGVPQFGANAIREQWVFPFVMGSHTARYASVLALYSQLTGNAAAREKAYRAFNWATYMISATPQGQIIDGPDVNNIWFSDGYTDFIRHFMRGMGSNPAWAPNGETHIVGSTSVVKSVTYGTGTVEFVVANAGATERLKLNFTPQEVTVDGVVLAAREDLSEPGWVFDAASGLLRIRHDAGTQVRVSNTTSAPDTDAPVISAVATSSVGSSSATISWTTNEGSDSQVAYGLTEAYGSASPLNPAMVTAHTVTLTNLTPETVYHFAVSSRDAAGNLATSTNFFFTTAAVDATPPNVAITFPEQGGTVSGTVTVTASAADAGGVAGVQFKLDGVNVGSEDTTAPYAAQWNTTALANGTYSLTATARDTSGNIGTSAPVVVTVSNVIDTTGPAVNVTAPTGGTVSGSVTLTASASDDIGVVGVQFLVDGVAVGSEDTTAPYSIAWDSSSVANGAHTVSARARDAAGNSTTSTGINITVSNAQATTVDFNSHPSQNTNLNGAYPTGVIDWGNNVWFLSGPFGSFTTKSVSFNRPGITSGTFTFVSPKRLISVRAYNGGFGSTTLTFACNGNPTRTVTVGANQVTTVSMTWGANCSTVTFTSSNGWDTNLDDFIFDVVQ